MDIDHDLIQRARACITGANVHRLKTWIFCYETSLQGTDRRMRYEALLRGFVTKSAAHFARQNSVEAVALARSVVARSEALNLTIDQMYRPKIE